MKAGSSPSLLFLVGTPMLALVASLIVWQAPSQPESVVWQYQTPQDFYVEETQRQLVQTQGATKVSSYFDFTYLWYYQIVSASDVEVTVNATLDKVRVNNSTEMGGRTSELLKQHEKTKSSWKLTRTKTGWKATALPGGTAKHAPPFFLTLGTSSWDQNPPGWKQEWSMPIAGIGQASLFLNVLLKQQTTDRMFVSSRAQLAWQPKDVSESPIKLLSSTSNILGLGEYDLTKFRWIHFEFYTTANWTIPQGDKLVQMKQDTYVGYRHYERRPIFP